MTQRKESHIWYSERENEVHISSHDKGLNKRLKQLAEEEPDAVEIYDCDDSIFSCSVKRDHFGFRISKSLSDETRKKFSESGKQNLKNLKNRKEQ